MFGGFMMDANYYGMPGVSTEIGFLVFLAVLWTLGWKAWALWIAARQGQKVWFAVFMLVNFFGIPEILYIFIFSKKDIDQVKEDLVKIKNEILSDKKEEKKEEVKVEPVVRVVEQSVLSGEKTIESAPTVPEEKAPEIPSGNEDEIKNI